MSLYLKHYFSFFLAGALLLSFNILYLYLSGEYTSSSDVVIHQRSHPVKSIYGSALHNNTVEYKRDLLEHVRPDVVVLGSSRVMQFRQHMFSSDVITLGGAMSSIEEGFETSAHVYKTKPKVVILGVDTWWFNDAYEYSNVVYTDENIDITPDLRDAWVVLKWLYDKKIFISDILNSITGKSAADYGVAGQSKDGFGPDGSKYYSLIITGEKESDDIGFKNTYARIDQGKSRFQHASSASDEKIGQFIKLIDSYEKQGIHVVSFLPPFAPSVHLRMKSLGEKYQYINDLKHKLDNKGIKIFDYTDPSVIGSNDCEFIDGFHGGEVTFMRVLRDLSLQNPVLRQYVRNEHLESSVIVNNGRSFVPDQDITSKSEVDYLKLGCVK